MNADPAPYIWPDGTRQPWASTDRTATEEYAPRAEFDTDDPFPWEDPYTHVRFERQNYLTLGYRWAPRSVALRGNSRED